MSSECQLSPLDASRIYGMAVEFQTQLKLEKDDDISQYRSTRGFFYTQPPRASTGYSTVAILQELYGLPLSNLVLSFVHGFNPRMIRVTEGEVTTDSQPGRVTIFVDAENRVVSIEQEISVLYGCGHDVQVALRQARAKLTQEAAPGT